VIDDPDWVVSIVRRFREQRKAITGALLID